MNNYGFYIKKLILEGNNCESAEIAFTKGLNVIYGASDTGKTYIYQCIDYMLGAKDRPKNIPEARYYTRCKLEIESYQGDYYLLERALKGGDFKLLRKNSSAVEFLLSKNNKSNKGKTISDFLLNLCNLSNKKIRKNAKGETQNLYFQSLRRFFLVNEEKIITQKSPVRTEQRLEKTFQENIFRFLLSGADDADIVSTLKKDEITNKKGKIELFDELISNLKNELPENGYEDVDKQIEKLDEYIETFRNQYLVSNQEFQKYNNEKVQLYSKILEKEKRLLTVTEILKRSFILKDQYHSDISRLRATLEASYAFESVSTSNCPLCDSVIEITDNTNIEELITSVAQEIKKITLLIKELNHSHTLFLQEKKELSFTLIEIRNEYDAVLSKITNELNEKLKTIALKIQEISSKKDELSKIRTLKNKLNEYTLQRSHINNILTQNKELGKDTEYDKLTASLLKPVLDNIFDILSDIKFDKVSSVTYSEEYHDFILGDKNRRDFGKGYRAILYAVFTLAVYEYLTTMPYAIGMVMIDSPLNPYKPDEAKDNGVIAQNLANDFYEYLANKIVHGQVILIENTEVPKKIINKINYIQYTKSKGFIPA
ncbi:MAG: hypothetical protein DRI84_05705 [Bacteroidetes bacterium]|nr:MAG: hypothetical protein DRI84_05705 [Bacteroidota bacterium]